MSPYSRMMWTLIAALILWSPACLQTVSGQLDATISALYFLGALLLAYMGTGIVDAIANNYRRTAERVEYTKRQIQLMEEQALREQRRRSSDEAAK